MTQPEQPGSGGQLWFPGLAADLIARFETRHEHNRWLVSECYGTHRWLSSDSTGLRLDTGAFWLAGHTVAIERLPAATAALFTPLTMADIDSRRSSTELQAAAGVLSTVEGLDGTVGQWVKVVHLLEAPAGHDVSHSSPELPFSIFVSVPGPGEKDISLRLTESMLHESMHLQLTLMDLFHPIVTDELSGAYSPWKDEVRPLSGIVHGLYVFAVIHQALKSIQDARPDWSPYCRNRRVTIEDEVAILPELPCGLSRFGADLWHQCRRVVLGACSDSIAASPPETFGPDPGASSPGGRAGVLRTDAPDYSARR